MLTTLLFSYISNIAHFPVQAKLHDKLEDHVGQLAAEMKSVRDEYEFSILGKRKRDECQTGLQEVRLMSRIENVLGIA